MTEDLAKLVEAKDRATRAAVDAREAGRYLFSAHQVVVIAGDTLDLTLHFAEAENRVVCVGVDLRSFVSDGEGGAVDQASVTPLTHWTEITTVLLRRLALGHHVNFAMEEQLRNASWQIVGSDDDDERAAEHGRELVDRVQGSGQRRRGPKPLLNDDALARVVAPAYRVGGRKPVVAVQAALLESGLLGKRVTIDQARKAVTAARARGFIPPAKRPGRGQEATS